MASCAASHVQESDGAGPVRLNNLLKGRRRTGVVFGTVQGVIVFGRPSIHWSRGSRARPIRGEIAREVIGPDASESAKLAELSPVINLLQTIHRTFGGPESSLILRPAGTGPETGAKIEQR